MKKFYWFLSAIAILILFLVFYNSNNVSNFGSLNYNCSSFVNGYPGARGVAHEQAGCFDLYTHVYSTNDSTLCFALKDDISKEICKGISMENFAEIKDCKNNDICIINAVKKLNKLDLIQKNESLQLCKEINNKTFQIMCYGFTAYRFNDTSVCNFSGEDNVLCLHDYLVGKSYSLANVGESSRNVPICNSLFESEGDLISCYELAVPNYWNSVNQTNYGNLTFFNLKQLNNKLNYLLQLRKENVQVKVISYDESFYTCDSKFVDENKISVNCNVLKAYCGEFASGCFTKYPVGWGYFDTYFNPK